MQRRSEAECATPAPTNASVNAAQEIVGEENLRKMKERWTILDTAEQGYLEKEQVCVVCEVLLLSATDGSARVRLPSYV